MSADVIRSWVRPAAIGLLAQVLTVELVREVFELNCLVMPDPVSGTPLIVPTDGEWR